MAEVPWARELLVAAPKTVAERVQRAMVPSEVVPLLVKELLAARLERELDRPLGDVNDSREVKR